MNWIDILFIFILIATAAYSAYRGLVKEIFSLASLVIGYISAANSYLTVSSYTAKLLNPAISKWVSFAVIFIVVWVIVILIGKLLQKIIRVSVTLSIVDRVTGGVIGIIKGIFILSVFILLFSAVPFTERYLLKSFTTKYMINISKALIGISPVDFVKDLRGDVNMNRFITTRDSGEEVSEEDRKKLEDIINREDR
ncbi:MAG: CvpA family protein [Nitrospinota bacterium]